MARVIQDTCEHFNLISKIHPIRCKYRNALHNGGRGVISTLNFHKYICVGCITAYRAVTLWITIEERKNIAVVENDTLHVTSLRKY